MNNRFNIFIDTGGTFTDCIAVDTLGKEYRYKVLSNSSLRGRVVSRITDTTIQIDETWNLSKDIVKGFSLRLLKSDNYVKILKYDLNTHIIELDKPIDFSGDIVNLNFEITSHEEAPVLGIRLITQTALNESFPDLILKLGSTKGTNALLERKGAKTLLLITKGFKDLLEIGNQARPDIFALNVEKRKQLVAHTIEVEERTDTNGNILKPIDEESIRKQIESLKEEGIEAVAIAFMNAYRNPQHEKMAKELVSSMGCNFVSGSCELSPLIKILPRAETVVADSYLSPIINNYVGSIRKSIGDSSFQIMTSAGGLVAANHFYPKDSLLSGPAGGVVGASIIGERAGFDQLITFDMGGTSTDVSRFSGEFDYRYELQVGDSIINSSAIAIETVAAGGGSICGYDGYKLFVGPESASAFPGPACYGAGGPLTITDVNLLLGRLDSGQFGIPVYIDAAREKLNELISEIEQRSGRKQNQDTVLNGFIEITNEIMAGAIRRISISEGYNPKHFAMVAFGGAGGLHACDMADILNIQNILLPRDAGLLSAYGIGNARIERFSEKQILKPYSEVEAAISDFFEDITETATQQLFDEGFKAKETEIRQQMLFLRFVGQDSSLEIDKSIGDVVAAFHQKYEQLFGHKVTNREIELEAIRVIVSVKKDKDLKAESDFEKYLALPDKSKESIAAPVFFRDNLRAGANIPGPALFLDSFSTTYIKEGWNLELQTDGTALIRKSVNIVEAEAEQSVETELELFANRFMSIATNMGALLQRTALSVNIKERLDFSCALLDASGKLVANAPHIPVHLGGLGVCVQTLLEQFSFEAGDTIVTNHPKFGGSHLPDVTLITPVFYKGERVAFVVNRAHHSEIGGISPGSMPPDAKNLGEEGVVISPFYLIRKGKVDWKGIREILENAPYPSRSVEENLADLNAAIAANKNGENALLDLIEQYNVDTVLSYFDLLNKHASKKMRETLSGFPTGVYEAEECLDDGAPICVKVALKEGTCSIDFTGSSDVHPGNMNATKAIVNSVVIYVLRLLLNESIPLNEGLMEPVSIILPNGMLNPVFDEDITKCPAVVGGNVEISMRLTDTLLKAFGVVAASQGTMNNVLFGNKNFGYYETICGGCGAGNGFNGASAVHHHMTNTRITDPEIMEHRYPVRLEEFAVRKHSGGTGRWNGGDGITRRLSFLEPVNLSVLTQRRKTGPYGLQGGESGKTGKQQVIKKNGETIVLSSIENINIESGDQFIIETPGGGGYGRQ